MDSKGPRKLLLTITGENFRPNDRVVVEVDDPHLPDATKKLHLQTEFVSPNELRIWLPRKEWENAPRVSYRLVVRTAHGQCATEVFEKDRE
jgi:hypothetical protein